MDIQRIMIIGQPGSGKSTLAREVGRITGLPVVHMDRIHWQAGWIERDRAEKSALCRAVHQRESWVFEGGHSATWPERLERCDVLIWLDLPFLLRFWRVLLRTWRHLGEARPDLPEGCPERFDPAFLGYVWRTRRSGRARIARFVAEAPKGQAVVILRSAAQVRVWLAGLPFAVTDG